MSDRYSGGNFSGIVNVTIADDSGGSKALDRATKLLAGIPGGVQKAAESALNRAAKSGRAGAAKEVGKDYTLKAADFKKYTKSSQHIQKSGNEISVGLNFRGYHVPLIRFNAKITSSGLYRVQVKRSSSGDTFKHVFRATMNSGHIGLFERSTKKRLPIEQKLGPSVPQMMGANPNLANSVGTNVRKVFEERMEHEITAILNGWRA